MYGKPTIRQGDYWLKVLPDRWLQTNFYAWSRVLSFWQWLSKSAVFVHSNTSAWQVAGVVLSLPLVLALSERFTLFSLFHGSLAADLGARSFRLW